MSKDTIIHDFESTGLSTDLFLIDGVLTVQSLSIYVFNLLNSISFFVPFLLTTEEESVRATSSS
jgi:hypothetical protein